MTSVESAEGLIDFSGGSEDRKSLAKLQIEGSVALYNILSQQKLAYLADEVGMGKTYVALGTIALMRKKQPDLRVLYLLPKNNVRDKWVKDYKSFVEHNYLHDDLIVRSLDRTPAAPHVVCKGLEALIREAAQGNNQDIFLCTSSLSFALGSEVSSIEASLKKLESIYSVSVEEVRYLQGKLNQKDLTDSDKKELKKACKQLWAKAINRILPKFDLIVVDEAHNFKRGAESSDRNRNLSTILGTNSKCSSVNLIKNVLLLSATPYEYSLSELDNQFQLFGESVLANKDKITRESALPKFMVRRLNELQINGIKHTRNMYRDEHRTGENAEVQMNDSQKLFAALMQKRVSEHLRENFAGKYQTGLLASFESYVPSSLSEKEHLTFDGEDDERKEEAKDNNIIGQLISSYQQEFSQTPPHPKMDWVVKQLHEQIYTQGKKQLIFVRRVASVGELKKKFEESYDKEFIYEHIKHDNFVEQMYNYYLKNKYNDELNVGNNELLTTQNELEGDFASDDFFTWFYRGRNAYVEGEIDKRKTSKSNLEWVTPFNYRNKINSRSTMFELNWAKLITSESNRHYKNDELIQFAQMLDTTNTDTDDQKRFQVAQYCYLRCLEVDETVSPKLKQLAAKLVKYLYNGKPPKISLLDQTKLELVLETETFFEQVNTDSYLQEIFPFWGKSDFICSILNENDPLKQDRAIHLREILRMVIGYICRVDHPWVDLYSVRGKENEQEAFIKRLSEQKKSDTKFNSYRILSAIAKNINLLIKLNFSDAYRKEHGDLLRYISNQIRNLQSSAGASGINSGDRSPLARRFRMPGYPMVLISTDVFQEGEDLHTFCDSVSHYGLSSSPIALEQKVGRVDRIGSLAQREIQNAENSEPEKHFIQVRYPHIKESVEYMQIQHSAYNLNRFIRNLHKIGSEIDGVSSDVDIDQQAYAIEPQIRDPLESPYDADIHFQDSCAFKYLHDDTQTNMLKEMKRNIENVYLKDEQFEFTAKGISKLIGKYEFELRAARKSNELVVSVNKKTELNQLSSESLLNRLQKFARSHFCRLQVKHNGNTLEFNKNVERLFHVQHTKVPESSMSLMRDFELHNLAFNSINLYKKLQQEAVSFLSAHPELHLEFINSSDDSTCCMAFSFIPSGRKQRVFTQKSGDYISLHTKSVSPMQLDQKLSKNTKCDDEILLRYTAKRNVIYDLVDFHIDRDAGISVRTFCLKSESSSNDILRAAYRVAREGDRLEYLFSDVDAY